MKFRGHNSSIFLIINTFMVGGRILSPRVRLCYVENNECHLFVNLLELLTCGFFVYFNGPVLVMSL